MLSAAFALYTALLDDIEVLALAIETQLTVLHPIGRVRGTHLVESLKLLQERHGAIEILQHRRLTCLGKGVSCAHMQFQVHWMSILGCVLPGAN